MKTMFATVLVALTFASPVMAQSSVIDDEVIRLKAERAKSYEGRRCTDDNLPHDMAAYCFNAVTGVRAGSPIGASEGGSE
jgi:hypothetical protein